MDWQVSAGTAAGSGGDNFHEVITHRYCGTASVITSRFDLWAKTGRQVDPLTDARRSDVAVSNHNRPA